MYKKKKGAPPTMKKLLSLLLSLLLCLSLLPGQALAADEPDPPQPPVIEEPLEPGEPEPPEDPPIMPTSKEDMPRDENEHI